MPHKQLETVQDFQEQNSYEETNVPIGAQSMEGGTKILDKDNILADTICKLHNYLPHYEKHKIIIKTPAGVSFELVKEK